MQQVMLRWVREFLFEDWALKLLALAIALGLWFAVTEQRSPATVRLRGVKLVFLLPEELELSNVARDEAEFTLEGSRIALDQINVRDLVASVDINSYKPGERVVKLVPEVLSMDLPEGVRIKKIDPTQVAVRIEPRIEREVKVEPRLEGDLPEGYVLKSVTVTPSVVKVRGPLSSINELKAAATETVSLNNLNEGVTDSRVAIDIQDQRVASLESLVSVRLEIEERSVEKTFGEVRIYSDVDQQARGESLSGSVVVRGPVSLIQRLSANDLSVIMEKASDGGRSLPRLELPAWAQGKIELQSVKR